MRWQWRTLGRPVAPAPRACLHPRPASPCLARSLLLRSLLSPAAAEHACSPPPPHSRALAGVGRPGHQRSPPAATSHTEHCLHLAHPALASVSRDGFPSTGIARQSMIELTGEAPLRGLLLSALPPALFSRGISTALRCGSSRAHPFPCHGRGHPTGDHPRRHARRRLASQAPLAAPQEPLGSREGGESADDLGLAGDLIVGEISPVSAAPAQLDCWVGSP
jgi:hypothetical protein